MLFDIHAHFNDDRFKHDRNETIKLGAGGILCKAHL